MTRSRRLGSAKSAVQVSTCATGGADGARVGEHRLHAHRDPARRPGQPTSERDAVSASSSRRATAKPMPLSPAGAGDDGCARHAGDQPRAWTRCSRAITASSACTRWPSRTTSRAADEQTGRLDAAPTARARRRDPRLRRARARPSARSRGRCTCRPRSSRCPCGRARRRRRACRCEAPRGTSTPRDHHGRARRGAPA